ncbi:MULTISPECIES: sigma-70 family RNA polymerase sigma factor [unclassified Streptomyces]|uniref:RNA polymerase sigma factor n=1 Tax=unclassified Streptomyces TaxID=2593676 RepID=UPI0033BE9AED|nr:sigma-70 family RNA polymerase sigma factor [Streptomyces sp. NBC_01176]
MTDDLRAEDGGSPVAEAVLPLPLEFEALYLAAQDDFHHYALLYLGTNDAAEEAVHRAFLEILRHWDALLEEHNLLQQTWAIVRRVVISQSLIGFRRELALLRSDIGLWKALSALPPRQFDAIVMRYVLDCDTKRISWYMGVTASTVDYHCRKAKERLQGAVPSHIKKEGDRR